MQEKKSHYNLISIKTGTGHTWEPGTWDKSQQFTEASVLQTGNTARHTEAHYTNCDFCRALPLPAHYTTTAKPGSVTRRVWEHRDSPACRCLSSYSFLSHASFLSGNTSGCSLHLPTLGGCFCSPQNTVPGPKWTSRLSPDSPFPAGLAESSRDGP